MKRKQTAAENPTSKKIENGVVNPIVAWCEKERGRKAAFVRALEDVLKPETVRTDRVYEWLHSDETQRATPPFGLAVCMIRAAHALKIPVKFKI